MSWLFPCRAVIASSLHLLPGQDAGVLRVRRQRPEEGWVVGLCSCERARLSTMWISVGYSKEGPLTVLITFRKPLFIAGKYELLITTYRHWNTKLITHLGLVLRWQNTPIFLTVSCSWRALAAALICRCLKIASYFNSRVIHNSKALYGHLFLRIRWLT